MELKSIFIVIVDISGYTRFIKKHRVALLHAEKIIGELMESILDKVRTPVVAHEILGDAVSLYAEDSGDPGLADALYDQTLQYFQTFRETEAALISDCQVCSCPACDEIGQLKLKCILHYGQAAFTKVKDIRKISGENVILAHRLLKNSIASNEYILMTKDFSQKTRGLDLEEQGFELCTEDCEGLGSVPVLVKSFEAAQFTPAELTAVQRLRKFLSIFSYTFPRVMFGKILPLKRWEFRNLPS